MFLSFVLELLTNSEVTTIICHESGGFAGDVWHNFHGGSGKDYFGLAIKSLMKKKIIKIDDLAFQYKKIPLQKGRHKRNPIPPLNKKHYSEKTYPCFQGSFKGDHLFFGISQLCCSKKQK